MISRPLITRMIVRELGYEQTNPLEIGDSRVQTFKTENTPQKRNSSTIKSPASKFRDWANALQVDIDYKTAPLSQNWTAKRGREHAVRVHEGNNLKRMQQVLYALADAWEGGTLPPELEYIRTKKEILGMVRTRGESVSYYNYCELHGEFVDNRSAAKTLRDFCGVGVDSSQRNRSELDQLLHDLRINPPAGFFPTPRPVAALMLTQVAGKLQQEDVRVLEPSAGIGSIIDVVNEVAPHASVHVYEINGRCRAVLKLKGFEQSFERLHEKWPRGVWSNCVRWLCSQENFLLTQSENEYDVILMNPPFENRQDEQHVRKAYELLRSRGRLVAIVSAGAILNERSRSFVDWLDSLDASWQVLPEDSFNSVESFRRTGVRCYMVTIDKE